MSAIVSEPHEISKEKYENLAQIEHIFSAYLDKKCWLTSNESKEPYNPKTRSKGWGNYDYLCTFAEMQEFLIPHPSFKPCLIPSAAGLIGIDVDEIKDEGQPLPLEIRALIKDLDSYAELSQSGTGVHIVLPGKLSGSNRVGKILDNKIEFLLDHPLTLTGYIIDQFDTLKPNDSALSKLYSQVFPAREVSKLTCKIVSPTMSDDEVLELCRRASNKEKFESLFLRGDISAYQTDDSSADFALCALLSFYTQDADQIFRLFQRSALYQKEDRKKKWARDDYRIHTIEKAIQGRSECYQPKKVSLIEQSYGSWESPAQISISEHLNTPFPINALPFLLRQAVEETARFAQTDPALPFVPGQGQLSLQLGKKIIVEEKEGLYHHPSLFLVGAASTGERKSSIDEGMLGLLKDQIESEIPDHEFRNEEIKIQNDLIKEQIDSIKKQIREGKIRPDEAKGLVFELNKSKGKALPELVNFCDDITPQRLFQKLHAHNGAYGIFSSDGRKIFNRLMGRGDREGATGEDIYVSAMWGDTIYRSRVGGGKEGEGEDLYIRKPALTVSVFIQPDLWEEFLRNRTMRESGLIARICMVNPTSRMGYRLETEHDIPLNYSLIRPYTDTIMKIRRWQPEKPLTIRLSPEAVQERRDYYNAIESELRPGGQFEDVKDIATRNISITTRLAGSWHLFEAASEGLLSLNDVSIEISREQWLKAQQCGEYFLAQGIDMQRTHGSAGKHYLLQKVATWLTKLAHEYTKTPPLFTLKSEIINRSRGTRDAIDEILTALESLGWLRKAHRTRNERSHYYEVNLKIKNFYRWK